jgi:hypothetical protein
MRRVAEPLGYPGAFANGTGINRELPLYLKDQDDMGTASRLFRARIAQECSEPNPVPALRHLSQGTAAGD